MVNNIGTNGADSFFFPPNKSVPPVAKSLPPAAVNPATTGGASAVSKGNSDNFLLSSPAGNTAIVTANASLMPRVKDTSNGFWVDLGAVKVTEKATEKATEKEEGGILSLLNTKGSEVSFVPVSKPQVQEVQAGLVKASNCENTNDAQRIFQIIENS